MNMKVYFPGGKKVHADFNGFTHLTDQPARAGGEGSAPPPFDLFLASIGTCAGIYVLGFCQQRNISTEGIEISQNSNYNPELKRIDQIDIEIKLPPDFPEKYRTAVVQAANLCAVKKHLETPPRFQVTATIG
jgi:ribosomal protein S12 methylthiotransferase accessory factor